MLAKTREPSQRMHFFSQPILNPAISPFLSSRALQSHAAKKSNLLPAPHPSPISISVTNGFCSRACARSASDLSSRSSNGESCSCRIVLSQLLSNTDHDDFSSIQGSIACRSYPVLRYCRLYRGYDRGVLCSSNSVGRRCLHDDVQCCKDFAFDAGEWSGALLTVSFPQSTTHLSDGKICEVCRSFSLPFLSLLRSSPPLSTRIIVPTSISQLAFPFLLLSYR